MPRLIGAGGIILIMLTLMSCATWPDAYLKTAVNHATQDAVAKDLGPPHLSRDLSTGEAVWLYGFTNTSGVYSLHLDVRSRENFAHLAVATFLSAGLAPLADWS